MALNFHEKFSMRVLCRAFMKNFIFPGQQCAKAGTAAMKNYASALASTGSFTRNTLTPATSKLTPPSTSA